MQAHDMQNQSEMTPIKPGNQSEDLNNIQSLSETKNHPSTAASSTTFSKVPTGNLKPSDSQTDAVFCSTNDPIFQPTASPNNFQDFKQYGHPQFGSTFRINNFLASTKKLYNNNLFLTPIKEDARFKPSFLNSIFKDSPHINTNNICRRLVFDDDIDELMGNSFMPAQNIFEEKKGVFSNVSINQLIASQNQHHNPQIYDQNVYGVNINALDFPSSVRSQDTNSGMVSPQNRKTYDTQPTHSQAEIQALSSQKKLLKSDLFDIDTPVKNRPQRMQQNIFDKEQQINIKDTLATKKLMSSNVSNISKDKANQLSESASLLRKNVNLNNQILVNSENYEKNTANHAVGMTNEVMENNTDNNNNGGDAGAGKKQKTCNCKKTKCLKLYCDCFAAGELCNGDCNCFGCYNTSSSEKRTAAICTIMDRQPEAFGPKVQSNAHKKGCNCTRSGCLKKYCECYTLGVNCGEYCKCQQCKNIGNPPQGIKIEDAKPSLEELEEHSSTKKKIFCTSTAFSLQLNQKPSQGSSQEEAPDEEVDEEEKEEDDDEAFEETDNENGQKDQLSSSPSQGKMYMTPLKSSNKRELRSLTTADTSKKQIGGGYEQDSEIKNTIVKLSITDYNNNNDQDNSNETASKSIKPKKGMNQQTNSQQVTQKFTNTHGLRSGDQEAHAQLRGGIIQLQNKPKGSH